MKKELILVFLFTALQGMIHNIGHPVTPDLVHGLGIPDYMFGVFFAMMSLGLMIGSPIFGVLGDRYPKRKLIFLGLLIYSIGQVAFGYGTNQIWMTFFRFLSGLGVASIMTLFVSYVIEHSTPNTKTRNLAIYSAIITLFAGFGYKIGGFLNHYEPLFSLLHLDEYRNIFLLQGIVNIFLALAVLIFLRETRREVQSARKLGFIDSFRHLKELDHTFIFFLIAVALSSTAAINLSKYLDVYFIDQGYSSNQLGTFVFVTGIVSVIGSILVVPILKKIHRDLAVLMGVQFFSGVIIFIVFRQSNFILTLYTLFNLYVLMKSIYIPFEQSFIASYADENSLGLLMGIRQSFVSIGMIVGPLLGGVLYNAFPRYVFDLSAGLFVIALIMLVIVFLKLQKRKTTLV